MSYSLVFPWWMSLCVRVVVAFMPDTIQAVTGFPLDSSWDSAAAPFLMSPYMLSIPHQRFACAHLHISYTWQDLSPAFSVTLTTLTLNQRSSRWFGNYFRKSSPGRAFLHLSYSYEQNFLLLWHTSTVHTDRVYGGLAGKDKIGCEKSHRFYRVFRIRTLLAFQLLLQYANK